MLVMSDILVGMSKKSSTPRRGRHQLPGKYRTGPAPGEPPFRVKRHKVPKQDGIFIVLRIVDDAVSTWASEELAKAWALPKGKEQRAALGVVEGRVKSADRRVVGFVRVGSKQVWGGDGKVIEGESVRPSDLVVTEEELRQCRPVTEGR